YVFHECAYSTADELSTVLGYTSILFWLFAQVPQLWKNWKAQSSDSLSVIFLCNWLSGDFANLIGCILTQQLPFQTYLALYFVFIDTSLFAQTVYFRARRSKRLENALEEEIVADEQTPLLRSDSRSVSPSSLAALAVFALNTGSRIVESGASTLSDPIESLPADSSYQLGRLFAWICCLLYLSSRLPQIYRNFERQSCHGLAMVMFGCALMGNVTYTASILVKSLDIAYLYNSLPYLLGSGGTVVFDVIIFAQWLAYSQK
ncbi:PQ loop repeat-containing protein 2, partial [Kappamyces sp. JEL0680]